jgi:hypothetical protein
MALVKKAPPPRIDYRAMNTQFCDDTQYGGWNKSQSANEELNRDHWPCPGRASYASTHAHLSTAGRETFLGIAGRERAGGAALLGADLRVYACVSRHCWPLERGPWAASGPEELRDSEWSHGCRRDAVTDRFQYLVPQVTVSDNSTIGR